jgi:hypothetical protein
MSDELKSAYELAMEKLRSKGAAEEKPLTDRQKEAIAEVRRVYEARRAEASVLHNQELAKLRAEGDAATLAKAEEQHERQMAALREDEEREVEEIRSKSE